ncbi:non-ribosomal peptide synthetase [Streptomyces sp. CB02923]|uniref:non-ribosomal peptide synthetase n=1 Tax=Streptomyces sp. CB02923 TaxID=1718985 RepID=UPI000B29CD38|nr:amino acid adenylation domain-containing protein [Streptomyces sp. CB02923]
MSLPLSPSQEIIWFHEQAFPNGYAYHFTAVIDLRGRLDTAALRSALAQLLARHSGLRLALEPGDHTPALQRVAAPTCQPRYATVDLTGEPVGGERYEEVLHRHATTPFRLDEAPLLRWTLVTLGPEHHCLLHTEHHLIHDGRSFAVALRDLFAYYTANLSGNSPELPTTRPYEEFLELPECRRPAEQRRRSVEHWAAALDGANTSLSLPGLSRGPARGERGAQLRRTFDVATATRLREISRKQGHTPFVTLLGLFGELLRRHSPDQGLVLGTAVDTRPEGFEESVGMFVNTVPVRLEAAPERPACEVIDDVAEDVVRGLAHADAPIQEVTRALGRYAADLRNPLFRAMFSAHDAVLPDGEVPGLEVTVQEGLNFGTVRFDIDVVLLPDARRTVGPRSGQGGMTLLWEYDADVFDDATVSMLHTRFEALVQDYMERPETPLALLDATPRDSAGEKPLQDESLQDESIQNPPAAHPEQILTELVSTVAARDPRRPALITGLHTLDHGALEQRIVALTEELRAHGVGEGALVACVLPKGADWIVALLACLRMGAVACPLSLKDPTQRRTEALRRLRPQVVLSHADTEVPRQLPYATPRGPAALVPSPPEQAPKPLRVQTGRDAGCDGDARRLPGAAYVIHTSGSTGRPKAVAVSRTALAHYLTAVTRRFGLTAEDRALAFAQPWFDVSLEEILPTLHAGGTVVLPRKDLPSAGELIALAAARGVSVLNLPTSYFLSVRGELTECFRQGRWRPRLLVLGGERLRAGAACEAAEALGGTVLNAYGITEATVTSTVHEVGAPDSNRPHGEVPLGRPLPGTAVYVVDAQRRPLPPGMVGEIAVCGPTLADGYLDAPEAQAARFATLPGPGGEDLPAYFSGDRGYLGPDGELCFLGRLDNQVKLRGHRIELEEIEAAARRVTGDVPCAVVYDASGPLAPRLVGFFSGGSVPPDRVSELLAEHLPGPLLPALWVQLETVPSLPGGKPDRAELERLARQAAPEPRKDGEGGEGEDGTGSSPAYGHGVRKVLAEGWREVLGHDAFTGSSHFFRVGGHSLLVIHLVSWLGDRLGARPPLRIVFENPGFEALAEALDAWSRERDPQPA